MRVRATPPATRTPLQPTPPTPTAALAESLVASAAGVMAVGKRKWSAVPLEVLEEGGPRAIALTDHLGCLLLASEDGTVHALQPAQRSGLGADDPLGCVQKCLLFSHLR
mgnify:CR=1 FL=1